MIEYITKEQAIGVVEEAIGNIINSDSESVNLTDLEIEIQMTITDYTDAADVAPAVHAQWEIPVFIDGNDKLDPRVKCSECGTVEAAFARWKYCPNCGARMDGSKIND